MKRCLILQLILPLVLLLGCEGAHPIQVVDEANRPMADVEVTMVLFWTFGGDWVSDGNGVVLIREADVPDPRISQNPMQALVLSKADYGVQEVQVFSYQGLPETIIFKKGYSKMSDYLVAKLRRKHEAASSPAAR